MAIKAPKAITQPLMAICGEEFDKKLELFWETFTVRDGHLKEEESNFLFC